MADRKKQDIHFAVVPTIEITDEESSPFWSRSTSEVEQPIIKQEKSSVSSSRVPKLLPYTPPDTLMFPLFSAIQRKAWVRAKRLCYELILCDPERKIYHDLYVRLDQITHLIDQRLHPPLALSQTTTASNDNEESSPQ